MPRKKPAQILTRVALRGILPQQPLNRFRNFVSYATVANGPAKSGVFTHTSAQAEVIGVLEFAGIPSR